MVAPGVFENPKHPLQGANGLVLGDCRDDDRVGSVEAGQTLVKGWRRIYELDVGHERERLAVGYERQSTRKDAILSAEVADYIAQASLRIEVA